MADRYIELIASTAQVHRDDLAFISRHLAMKPGLVLDVGCGPGHLTGHLRLGGIDAIGIDLVPEFNERARLSFRTGATKSAASSILMCPTVPWPESFVVFVDSCVLGRS
jgi:SAM-dependent methyltransferase